MAKRKAHRHEGHFPGKKGSGSRFEHCVQDVRRKGKVKNAKAVCAAIGRKKYGKGNFQKMAAAGKR
jgi:hypothetical protein